MASGVYEVTVKGKRVHVGFSNDVDRVVTAYKQWATQDRAPKAIQEAVDKALGKKHTDKDEVGKVVGSKVLVECNVRPVASAIKRAIKAGQEPEQKLLDAAKKSLEGDTWGRAEKPVEDDASDENSEGDEEE